MRRLLATAALLAILSTTADASIIDFEGLGLGNNQPIPANALGPNVTVNEGGFWGVGYVGMTNVALIWPGGGNAALDLTFTPDAGNSIVLESFLAGRWPGTSHNANYTVTDGITNTGPVSFSPEPTDTYLINFVGAVDAAVNLRIEMAPGNTEVGIDNIMWEQQSGGAIPEPTTLAIWSLLGGFGLVAGKWQRRKRTA